MLNPLNFKCSNNMTEILVRYIHTNTASDHLFQVGPKKVIFKYSSHSYVFKKIINIHVPLIELSIKYNISIYVVFGLLQHS